MVCRIAIKIYRAISEQYPELENFFEISIFGWWNLDSAFPTSPTEAFTEGKFPKKSKHYQNQLVHLKIFELRFLRAQKELDKILEILGPDTAPWGQYSFFMPI